MNKRPFLLALTLTAGVATAAPGPRPPKLYTQANGHQILLQKMGNQQLHWFETRAGEIVVYNPESKNYEYAALVPIPGKKGAEAFALEPSGALPGDPQFKPLEKKDLIPLFQRSR